jgi:hypothetical protein
MNPRKVIDRMHPALDGPDVDATASLSLPALLQLANSAYPDGFLEEYFDLETGARHQGSGDTLVEFVVIEISETFDPNLTRAEQLAEARRVLSRATRELEEVIQALEA